MSKKENILKNEVVNKLDFFDNDIKKDKNKTDNALLSEILTQLKDNQKANHDILKLVIFIKRYYFWRSITSLFKVVFIALVILLGIVSWGSIVNYVNSNVVDADVSEQILNYYGR